MLGPGKITPAVLQEWADYTMHFFDKNKAAENEQVSSVLTAFSHPSIKNWVAMNRAALKHDDYTFEMFMQALRKNFLDPQWINQILREVIYARMSPDESFEEYANRVLAGNNLLQGTLRHLSKALLRDTLHNHLADYLSLRLDGLLMSEREHMVGIAEFEDWLLFMKRVDAAARADRLSLQQQPIPKRVFDGARNFDDHYKRPRYVQPLQDSTAHNRPFRPTGANAVSARAPGTSYLPHLTDFERDVPDIHHGCKKCRRFYVKHSGANCPNEFPDGATYQPLTTKLAEEAHKASLLQGYDPFIGVPNASAQSSMTVAAIRPWTFNRTIMSSPPPMSLPQKPARHPRPRLAHGHHTFRAGAGPLAQLPSTFPTCLPPVRSLLAQPALPTHLHQPLIPCLHMLLILLSFLRL